jgi:hypothetical protein
MKNVKIENIIGSNGNKVKNQFVLYDNYDKSINFQSYESLICTIFPEGGCGFKKVIHFGKDWDYSVTTGKYLHIFLKNYGLIDCLPTKNDIQEAIDRGYCRMNENIAVCYDPTM